MTPSRVEVTLKKVSYFTCYDKIVWHIGKNCYWSKPCNEYYKERNWILFYEEKRKSELLLKAKRQDRERKPLSVTLLNK